MEGNGKELKWRGCGLEEMVQLEPLEEKSKLK